MWSSRASRSSLRRAFLILLPRPGGTQVRCKLSTLPKRWTPCVQVHLTGSNSQPSTFVSKRTLTLGPTLLATQNTSQVSDVAETSTQASWAEDAVELADLAAKGDLVSLGLGGYTPIGLLQTALDALHSTCHLPWWAAIASATVALRLCMVPIVVRMQRNTAKLNNIKPELDKIQKRIKEFQQTGNQIMVGQETARLMQLYQTHSCNPIKLIAMPFIQFPVFISFFLALRKMAALPIESMSEGGFAWFVDLTIPDPTYVLPFLGALSFMATIEMGGEAGVNNPQMDKLKMVFRIMAIVLIPVTAKFPAAVFMYWLTNSVLSMSQILLLRVPAVRSALGIPHIIKHPVDEATKDKGGFVAKMKESYQHSLVVDEGKRKDIQARKNYQKMVKVKPDQLYEKPPSRRKSS